MPITKVSDFSKDSFAFEDAVGYSYGSKKIGLTASDGGPLLLKFENCLAYGINKNNKFEKVNSSIPLAVGTHEEFVTALELLEKECARHAGKPGSDVMRCLSRKGKSPTLMQRLMGKRRCARKMVALMSIP
jgi:hypothetical protein